MLRNGRFKSISVTEPAFNRLSTLSWLSVLIVRHQDIFPSELVKLQYGTKMPF